MVSFKSSSTVSSIKQSCNQIAVVVVLTSTVLLPGCGGGGASGGGASANALTSRDEPSLSHDAVILAAQKSSGPWIALDIASGIDKDLKKIRAANPAVVDIHARGQYVLNDLLVALKPGAPWLAKWRTGALQTGDNNIDSLLTTYNLASVRPILTDGSREWFVLQFAQSLSAQTLIDPLSHSTSFFDTVETDGYAGDGDEITYTKEGATKNYVFRHGWGDCPSGCQNSHLWTVTIAADGTMTTVESGTPLDRSATNSNNTSLETMSERINANRM